MHSNTRRTFSLYCMHCLRYRRASWHPPCTTLQSAVHISCIVSALIHYSSSHIVCTFDISIILHNNKCRSTGAHIRPKRTGHCHSKNCMYILSCTQTHLHRIPQVHAMNKSSYCQTGITCAWRQPRSGGDLRSLSLHGVSLTRLYHHRWAHEMSSGTWRSQVSESTSV